MACKNSKCASLTDTQKTVLTALANSTEALAGKEIAASASLQPKQVSCQLTALKKKGYVASPVRCKYQVTDEGKSVLAKEDK